jgi:hypothetical protein
MASRLGCLHTVTDYLYDEEEIQAYRRRSSPATMHALFSVVYSSEDPPCRVICFVKKITKWRLT